MRNDFESTLHHTPQEKQTIAVEMPDGSPWIKLPLGNELLDAEFDRQSHNLLIETPAAKLVVEDYFASDHFPALLSETGKKVAGSSVETLAGQESPLEFAGPITAGGPAIGVVEKIKGGVTVTRDGQEVELAQGDPVFQQDVIKTDGEGSIGVTFEDGSVFTLGADARMTLDEFVYDPATGEGNSSVNVLKGMFKFVSGEIAANNPGDMQVETPVATIGIRGTTGGGSVQGEGADNQFYLEPNADGTVGWFDVTTAQGTVPMNQPNTVVGLKSFNDAPPAPQFVAPEQIKQSFSQVVDFAPAGKYEARQNNDAGSQNNAQQGADAAGNAAQEAQPADNNEASGENTEGEAKNEQEAATEGAGEQAGEEAGEPSEKNAADAKQESEQSAADSDVSANGEQSGEALESFSGNENFDGDAAGGEAPKDAGAAAEGGPEGEAPAGEAPAEVAPVEPAAKQNGFDSAANVDPVNNPAGPNNPNNPAGQPNQAGPNGANAPAGAQAAGANQGANQGSNNTDPAQAGQTAAQPAANVAGTFLQNQIANEQGLISEEGKILTPKEAEEKREQEQEKSEENRREEEQREQEKREEEAQKQREQEEEKAAAEGEREESAPQGEETPEGQKPLDPTGQEEPQGGPQGGSPNQAPAFATPSAQVSFAENSAGIVHTANAIDPQGDPFTYHLASGKFDNDLFAINAQGELTFKSPPDYEDPQQNGANANEYKVEIIVRDDKGAETRKLVEIDVTDVVEAAPNTAPAFTVSSATVNVAENTAAATGIYTPSASDADASDTLTYSIVGGADDSKFTIDSTTGELKFAASPDYENPTDAGSDNNYEVIIEASDGNGGTAQQTVNVTVDNENESPVAIADSDGATDFVAEDAMNGTAVGITALSSDPEAGSITYSLTNNAGGRFAIDSTTGVITVASGLDYETGSSHLITVEASDGTHQITKDFTIAVGDVAEGVPGADFTVTAANDSYVTANSGDNVVAVADWSFLTGMDTLDGGAGTDTLQIDAAVASNNMLNLGAFSNISNFEKFDIDADDFTLRLDSDYLTRNGAMMDKVIIDQGSNSMIVDTHGYHGGVEISGSGVVDVLGAATEEQYFTNSDGNSINLDLSNANSDIDVELSAGNHSIIGGHGEFNLYHQGAGNVDIDGGNSGAVDVILDGVSGGNVTSSNIGFNSFDFINADYLTLTLQGSADFHVELEDTSGMVIDASNSNATYSHVDITGQNDNLTLVSHTNGMQYTLNHVTGSVNLNAYGGDIITVNELGASAQLNFSNASSSTAHIEFNDPDGMMEIAAIDIYDFRGNGDLDLKLELANGRNLIFTDFYAANGDHYVIRTPESSIDLSDAAFDLNAMAVINLDANVSGWDNTSFTIDDGGTAQNFNLVNGSGGGNNIQLTTGDNKKSLDDIVSAINNSGLSGIEASHNGVDKIFLKTTPSYSGGALPSVTASSITVDDFDYFRFFEARGAEGAEHKEYGLSFVEGSVLGDHIYAIEDNQIVDGGYGNDVLIGNANNVTIYGGEGDDVYSRGANAGDQTFHGDGGRDTVDYSNVSGNMDINLTTASNNATNTTFTDSLTNIDIILTGAGADTIDGGAGDQTIDGGAGADSMSGGAGTDMVSYLRSGTGVTVDLNSGSVSGGDATGDSLSSFEYIQGSNYADTLTGSIDNNLILGEDGDDSITGGDGSDTLVGGMGNDTINLTETTASQDFIQLHSSGKDIIFGFQDGGAHDVIDLRSVISNRGESYFDLTDPDDPLLQTTDSGGNAILSFNNSDIAEIQGLVHTTLHWKHFVTDGRYQTSSGQDGNNDSFYDGTSGADVMITNVSSMALMGKGGNDILATSAVGGLTLEGGDGNDWIIYQNSTNVNHGYYIDGGNGFDTLLMEFAGPLDLSDFLSNNMLNEMEALNLNGNDLSNIAITNIEDFTGEDELFITGSGGETVNLQDAHWEAATTATLPAHLQTHDGYTTYISEGSAPGQEVAIHVENSLTVSVT